MTQFISLTLMVLFSCAMSAQKISLESWHQNYKRPDFFIKQNKQVSDDETTFSPDDPQLSGYIFEIDNHDPLTSLQYISTGLSKYLSAHNTQTKAMIDTPNTYIFFMPTNKGKSSKRFYKEFAQTISWLLFNRRDTRVAIRPVFAKEKQLPFQPLQAIYMDAPQVMVGHYQEPFVDPDKAIVDGFHIHMDYLEGQKKKALQFRDKFIAAAAKNRIIYSDLDSYPEHFNGPHVRAGWEVKFERAGSQAMEHYGYALAWLLLNHQDIPIYSHSKSWLFGENEKRLISHLDNALYSGIKPKVDQWFFYNPTNEHTGLYRWDSQLPSKGYVSAEESLQKQEEILRFWFGKETGQYPLGQSKKWFNKQQGKPTQFDQQINEKFGKDIILMANHYFDNWQNTPKGALASVLLLDQFPRNIYRGKRMAFAFDPLALAIAKSAIQKGFDKKLSPAERLFLYLPLEHSENLNDQITMVRLMEKLKNEVPDSDKAIFITHYKMAVKHKMTIEKFHYFPSRNPNFNAKISSAEMKFMQTQNAAF